MLAAATFQQASLAEVLVSVAIMAGLSMIVFRHASKHGSRRATAWGIAGFFLPGFVIYFIHYYVTRRRI